MPFAFHGNSTMMLCMQDSNYACSIYLQGALKPVYILKAIVSNGKKWFSLWCNISYLCVFLEINVKTRSGWCV